MEVLQTGSTNLFGSTRLPQLEAQGATKFWSYRYLSNTSKAVNAGATSRLQMRVSSHGEERRGNERCVVQPWDGVWSDYNVSGQGTVKDITWLPEPVTYSGITYIAVGIEENNGNQSVLYAADGRDSCKHVPQRV